MRLLAAVATFALLVGMNALVRWRDDVRVAIWCAVVSDIIGLLCDIATMFIFAKYLSELVVQNHDGNPPPLQGHLRTLALIVTKVLLLSLLGVISSCVVVIVLATTHDIHLIAGIMCCDGVVNVLCMTLCFAFAQPYYERGCFLCDRAMILLCMFVAGNQLSSSIPEDVNQMYRLL